MEKAKGMIVQHFVYRENKERDYELHLGFVISPYRKRVDRLLTKEQTVRHGKGRFSRYGQSLLESCFKNW